MKKNIFSFILVIISIFLLSIGIYQGIKIHKLGIKNHKLASSLEEKAIKEVKAKAEIKAQKKEIAEIKQKVEDMEFGDKLWDMIYNAKIDVIKNETTFIKSYTMINTSGKALKDVFIDYFIYDKNGVKIAKSTMVYTEHIGIGQKFTMTADVSAIQGRDIELNYVTWDYAEGTDITN
ncbi:MULTISPECIES: hypothetical protein [unclassified Neobacillus]|uniref:hypothetical protein n=1 Tax=unclassified Neobacillus TaxID=2675272 RepID=UPI0024BF46B2|nr:MULTISPECIES: hypothetical protein [unclassified Neobacillus]MDM5326893.1 hypothetical protein [Neobacillus sp. CF12]WHY02541.1 hypothetical protein QNH29_10065 [Neobacillus sp. DY30]